MILAFDSRGATSRSVGNSTLIKSLGSACWRTKTVRGRGRPVWAGGSPHRVTITRYCTERTPVGEPLTLQSDQLSNEDRLCRRRGQQCKAGRQGGFFFSGRLRGHKKSSGTSLPRCYWPCAFGSSSLLAEVLGKHIGRRILRLLRGSRDGLLR